MVANLIPGSRTGKEELLRMTQAQIENSIDLGWPVKDICLITNFDFDYLSVYALKADLNTHCSTGSKMFGIQWLMDKVQDDVYWVHDLDCWQGVWFDPPEFKDAGIAEYSQPKFNGGSVFWRPTARDIIDHVIGILVDQHAAKEEPTLNKVLKSETYRDRVTVLNSTFNLGCSGFVKRYVRAEKPICVSHFHPTNRIAWETHCLYRNGGNMKSISPRLETLIRRFWPNIATKLAPNDPKNKIRTERRKAMLI